MEQLQSLTSSGVVSSTNRTAPQWQDASIIGMLRLLRGLYLARRPGRGCPQFQFSVEQGSESGAALGGLFAQEQACPRLVGLQHDGVGLELQARVPQQFETAARKVTAQPDGGAKGPGALQAGGGEGPGDQGRRA